MFVLLALWKRIKPQPGWFVYRVSGLGRFSLADAIPAALAAVLRKWGQSPFSRFRLRQQFSQVAAGFSGLFVGIVFGNNGFHGLHAGFFGALHPVVHPFAVVPVV